MEFSFKAKVNASKEGIWEYYCDIQKWYTWEKDLKNITLSNGFQTGSGGIMELEGMPPMDYLLTCVKTNQEFWDETVTPLGSIYFGHEILCEEDGTVHIKHTVRLENEGMVQEAFGFLKQVFSDVPDTVMLLKTMLERDEAA